MFLQYIFDLRKVGFNDFSHPSKVLEQCRPFLLQFRAKDICDFGLHRSDDTLDFLLIVSVLRNKRALKLHDGLNDKLKLLYFLLFIVRGDIVVFQDFSDSFMELQERSWESCFNVCHIHQVEVLLIHKCDYCILVKTKVLFQLGKWDLFVCC
jgi:hypothetical protein